MKNISIPFAIIIGSIIISITIYLSFTHSSRLQMRECMKYHTEQFEGPKSNPKYKEFIEAVEDLCIAKVYNI